MGLNGLVACAAFRVQKTEQLLERFGVGRIPEERPFTPHIHQILVFQFFKMVRKGGTGDFEFIADLTNNQAVEDVLKEEAA